MEKIINVKVSGSEIEQSSSWGGIQGEGGTRYLEISFDEEWSELSKTVTFFDAYLSNPVKVLLTTTNLSKDGTYIVSIPAEPLITGVKFIYVIEGSIDGAIQKSVQKELKVKDAPIIDSSFLPSTVTPSLADQLNLSIHKEAARINELELKVTEIENNINDEKEVLEALGNKVDKTELEDSFIKFNERTKNYVTPEMYGAKGDGATDDTYALQCALSKNLPVVLTGTYGVSEALMVSSPYVIGYNAKITLLNDINFVLTAPKEFRIEGIEIDCAEKAVYNVIYSTANTHFTAKRLKVSNIYLNQQSNFSACGFRIQGGIVVMNDINVHNIYALKNDVIADAMGCAYGICIEGHDYCELKSLVMNDFHSVNEAGDIVFEDGGAVYIKKGNEASSAVISGVNIKNPGKYGIKTQTYNISISDVTVINELSDHKDGIVLLPAGGTDYNVTATVSNCHFYEKRTDVAENLTACIENQITAQITNCYFDTLSGVAVSNSGEVHMDSCNIKGCGISGLKNSTISNSKIVGLVAVADFSNTSCDIFNCHFEYSNYGVSPFNQYPLIVFETDAKINNCVFNLSKGYLFTVRTEADVVIRNSTFYVKNNAFEYITVQENASIKIMDSDFDLSESGVYCIASAGITELCNCNIKGDKKLIRVKNGTTNIKDMSLSKVDYIAGEVKNTPVYENALPTGSYPDGVYVTLLTDGALYCRTNGQWTRW